ncbi:delta(14)-sterol reductase LBR isoform X1 [Diorhabda carinulata]|uniref:delta(14)-sterol reductase LBR isoform X1 n=2 Tax=Diorhabda carinulata TaxID=1163345 RepID=UPI0025A20A2E|nr:delta(14)-sterol reductase LBR isoform X1 [Diorhabda carinulata]XP_057669771.1 delta(14)-sterol reductase LBR isoform X1 [Diorhabda carinulata]
MVGKGKTAVKPVADKMPTESTIKNSSNRSKSPNKPKSPGRRKSTERNKSPTLRRSPGRAKSTERTKSPARQKNPSRSSPARTNSETIPRPPTPTRTRVRSPARVKSTSVPKTSTPIQTAVKSSTKNIELQTDKEKGTEDVRPKKQKIIIDTDTDSDNASVPEIKEKPKAAVRGRTRRIDIESTAVEDVKKSSNSESIDALSTIRRFTRSSQNREIEKVMHLKHFDSLTVIKRLGEFSDEDELNEKKSQRELKEYAGNKKFDECGGLYGALFLIPAVPLSLIMLYTFCTQADCSFSNLSKLNGLKSYTTYFDAKSYLGIVAYFTLLAILTAIPAGGVKVNGPPNKSGKFEYRLNGLLSCLTLLIISAALLFKKIDVANYLVNHVSQFLVGSIILGIGASVLAYIRSFYVPVSALNSFAVGKNGLYGFFIGREINPRLFSIVDLKLLFFRASIIGTVLLDLAFVYNNLDPQYRIVNSESTFTITPKLSSIQPTLLIFTILHVYYFLDSLIFESSWLTSFTHQQEGFGYLLVLSYCISPFLNALLIKYVVENNVELAWWKLLLSLVVYAAGLFLYRKSNNQKDAFRKNPYSPFIANLETIPTTQGKKLLASGLWGIVRHPNYLGDIIMHISWLPFVFSLLPSLPIILTILILVHRSLRDNHHCKQKYGAAWDRYRNKVRYLLLPKVY